MLPHNLIYAANFVENCTGVAQSAGSTAHYLDGVDMRGYEAVTFAVHLNVSTGAAGATFNAQMCASSSGTATWTDIYGTSGTVSTGLVNDSGLVLVDVYRPTKRYVRFYLNTRATGESIISATAIQYRPAGELPITPSTTYNVVNYEMAVGTSS